MKKLLASLLCVLVASASVIAISAETPAEGYPSSGISAPDGSVIIKGELIGNETGWGDNAAAGRAAAFDGSTDTFFDPLNVGDGYCGIDCGKEYVLTKIVIHPRTGYLDRFYGASIQGSNTGNEDDWTDVWMSLDAATEFTWQEIESSDFDVQGQGFRYYRYFNLLSHGDVAEVELYGYPVDGVVEDVPSTPAATTETPAAETAEPETIELTTLDYPGMDIAANSGAGYATLDEAAASIGKTPILGATFLNGSNGNNNEGPENLWDNDTTTKFCTGEFPTQSVAKFATPITIDGIIMATANDNSSYNNRSPFEWAVYASADGQNWTAVAYGDDTFFEETDFTYYATAVTPVENVQYVYFQSEGALSGCYQMSELVVTGTQLEAPAAETPAPAEETTAPAEETVETPAPAEETVDTPAEEAPQTFDIGIIAAAAAVVSAAGYAISRKRK